MRTRAGLWIDHKKATIVTLTGRGEETCLILSKVERHRRRGGDSPLEGGFESQQVPADDTRQRVLTGHLNTYYKAVAACLRDAEAILLFGPGEAKGELRKRLEKSAMGERIVAFETADKMTDRQVAAKIRRHFAARVAAEGRHPVAPRAGARRPPRHVDLDAPGSHGA